MSVRGPKTSKNHTRKKEVDVVLTCAYHNAHNPSHFGLWNDCCIRPSHAIAGRASSGHRTSWATKLDTVQTCTFRAIAVKEQLPLKRFQWAPRSPKDPDSCQPHFKSAIPCIKPCKCNMVPNAGKMHHNSAKCRLHLSAPGHFQAALEAFDGRRRCP